MSAKEMETGDLSIDEKFDLIMEAIEEINETMKEILEKLDDRGLVWPDETES